MDISNGPGIRISVFVQGCPIQCPECFNKELWNFDGGKLWTEEQTNLILDLLNNPNIDGISWLGGEPTLYIEEIAKINKLIKKLYPDKTIWLYSGYTWTVLQTMPEYISTCDVIVEGAFDKSLKDPNLYFRGSSNQNIVNVKESFKQEKMILL